MNKSKEQLRIDETTMNDMIANRRHRKYGRFKFGNNLFRFFCEMHMRGYKVIYMSSFGEKVEFFDSDKDYTDLDEVTYQSQNYEGCNVTLRNTDKNHRQTVRVDYTGDDWCDVVPIIDWSIPRDKPDVVNMVIKMIREDVLGDEA